MGEGSERDGRELSAVCGARPNRLAGVEVPFLVLSAEEYRADDNRATRSVPSQDPLRQPFSLGRRVMQDTTLVWPLSEWMR
jgi:hypothetical protein